MFETPNPTYRDFRKLGPVSSWPANFTQAMFWATPYTRPNAIKKNVIKKSRPWKRHTPPLKKQPFKKELY